MSNSDSSNSSIPLPEYLLRPVETNHAATLEPFGDCVLFKIEDPLRTEGGLYVPEHVQSRQRWRVIAVGPGRYLDDGTRLVPQVQVGDLIVPWPNAARAVGTNVTGEEIFICRDTDIAARIVARQGQS